MLLLTFLIFASLTAATSRVSGGLLFPGALFSFVWCLSMLGLLVSGRTLYALSPVAYLVFLVGGVGFVAGSALGMLGRNPIPRPTQWKGDFRRGSPSDVLLNLSLVALVVFLPTYWSGVLSLFGDLDAESLMQNIRHEAVENSKQGNQLGLLGNLPVLAHFVALTCVYQHDGSRISTWRTFIAILLALIFGAMTGTKGNALNLIMSVFFIFALKRRDLPVISFILILALVVAVFALSLFAMNFVFVSFDNATEAVVAIVQTVQNYWLGGFVGFDAIANNPNIMESSQPVHRFFLETARSLGFDVYVPFMHADYTLISEGQDTNVYTIYFTYFKDFGWLGTFCWMFVNGVLMSWLFRWAFRGSAIGMIFYSTMCFAIVTTIFSEKFYLGLNGYLKLLIFLSLLYYVLPKFDLKKFSHE